MKLNSAIVLITALALTTGSASFAQERYGSGRDGRYDNHRPMRDSDDRRHYDRYSREDFGPPGRSNDRGPRFAPGYGHRAEFHRGARLPREYRVRQYVVDDWRGHRLHRPPRGYHWVQVGGDYVLVAIATGIILQVILSN